MNRSSNRHLKYRCRLELPSPHTEGGTPALTKTMRFLRPMFQSVFFGQRSRTLEAKIVGGQRGDRAAIRACRSLWYDRARIEDASKDHLVVADRAVHDLLGLCQKLLDML